MQLSQESRGTCWFALLAAWGLCAALVILHSNAVRDYIAVVDGLGRRPEVQTATPMQHVLPARYADTQMWMRNAVAAEAAGSLRWRFTTDDNAPQGREVHWASPVQWMLRIAARVRDIEDVVRWLNTPLFIGLMILLSGWAARRAGAAAGVLTAFAMAGHNACYESFAPMNVDHHGLMTASVFGLVLGVVFMGAGWWKPNLGGTFTTLPPSDILTARRAAIVSAICGATGMWISAASMIPAIALSGIAGLLAVWWRGNSAVRDGVRFEAQLWQLWGRVGAGLSLFFYLVEYAPEHLGWRLEVNHPLYALAWWGGAEFAGIAGAWYLERARSIRRRLAWRLVPPVFAVLCVPAAIYWGGNAVFSLRDPFVADLRHFVVEGNSLPAIVREIGFRAVAYHVASCVLLVPAVILAWRARGEGATLLGFATLAAAGFIALGFWEVRWWSIGSATQIVLLLVLVATLRHRWAWVLGLSAIVLLPAAVVRVAVAREAVRRGIVDERDILQPLYRDIAMTLRTTQPEGDITLLASPNASAGIGFYGGFRTVGTLYWENAPGLKAAAALFSARTDEEAAALVRSRRITHVAMVSSAYFISEYFQLLHPTKPADEARSTFGHRLATSPAVAPWLQPVAYRPPEDLAISRAKVRLFKVAFEQTEIERLYHTTIALAAGGDVAAAETIFDEGLGRLPAESRFVFAESIGTALYDYGVDAAAARAFRRALEFKPDPNVRTSLAWILATTSNTTLRDGRAALALIDPVAQVELNDPTVLSALAAALAEVGRFPDAIVMAERALGSAQAANDPAALPVLQRRLEAYRAGRAWRQ
jgi:tetratricopeptide (TPR) repeat protein